MQALIDGDRLPYAFGGFTGEDGKPIAWPLLKVRIDNNISTLLSATETTEHKMYLTANDGFNFRYSAATIRPYKGTRPTTKPFWYESIRRYLVDEYDAEVISGMEADDAIGIDAYSNPDKYIICSVDKDLNNIPGRHYDELKPNKGIYWVDERDALGNFYSQLLTGDRTDNIPGLFGVGGKSSLLTKLRACSDELTMYTFVRSMYEKYFGSYWKLFLHENGCLAWILRSKNTNELRERFSKLEEERVKNKHLEVLELDLA